MRPVPADSPIAWAKNSRRDRRGRGPRGPIIPATAPRFRTRSQRFDDIVLAVIEPIESRWAKKLRHTQFAVEDVPASDPAPWEAGTVPLARLFPDHAGQPARIVIYRRPIEMRCDTPEQIHEVVHTVIVEQVAQLLKVAPDVVDPNYEELD